MSESKSSHAFSVGETVRAPLPDHPKARRRAVIATIQEDGISACLLWEDDAPRYLAGGIPAGGRALNKTKKNRFLLAPSLQPSKDEIESSIAVGDLSALLDFEQENNTTSCSGAHAHDMQDQRMIEKWKDRGDQLLRLGDAAAAVSYYETALMLSSSLQIGGSVLIKQGGNIEVAEVDCVNEEENTVDITVPKSGEERCIPESRIKLCVSEEDEGQLQERVLLNISRCFIQLAETTKIISRRPLYLRSAYLACTLAINVNSLKETNVESSDRNFSSSTLKTALLLRSQAYALLNQYPYAIADIKRLLTVDPQHKEAKRRLRDLERQKLELAKTDKRLAKEVCKWVQEATIESESVSARDEISNERIVSKSALERENKPKVSANEIFGGLSWLPLLVGMVLAWIVQKALF